MVGIDAKRAHGFCNICNISSGKSYMAATISGCSGLQGKGKELR